MTRLSMHALKKRGMNPVNPGVAIDGFYEFEFSLRIDGRKIAEYWMPVKIKTDWVPSFCPHTGEQLDTFRPDQRAWINGVEVDPHSIWTSCCARPIDEEQYNAMIEVNKHG